MFTIFNKKFFILVLPILCILNIGFLVVFAETFLPGNDDKIKETEYDVKRLGKHSFLNESTPIECIKKFNEKDLISSNDELFYDEIVVTIYDGENYANVSSDDRTKIVLKGRLPKGAIAKAYKVEPKIKNLNVVIAYDIKIFDNFGKEFQPDKEAPISVSFESESLKNKTETDIFHLQTEKSAPEMVAKHVVPKGNKVSFEANGFSIYIVSAGETPSLYKHTYEFYDKDGNIINEITEKISTGEILKEPFPPNVDHHIFEGWYTAATGGSKFARWVEEEELTENKKTKLYARYRGVYHVYYNSEARVSTIDNPVMLLYTQNYPISDIEQPIHYEDITLPLEEGYALIGWSLKPDGTEPVVDGETKVRGDMQLFPIIKKARWIVYESNGGSIVDPKYILDGDVSVEPKSPTKAGYKFDGWYSDENFQNKFNFGNKVTQDVKLYAKWKEAESSYTVVFWEQNVSDGKNIPNGEKTYSYKNSETRTGTTGEDVSISYQDKRKDIYDTNYHFHYNPVNSSGTKKINPDGSTILNVYYDRDLFRVRFQQSGYYGSQTIDEYTGLYGSSLRSNGYTWKGDHDWTNNKDGLRYTFLSDFIFPDGSYTYSYNSNNPEDINRNKVATLTLQQSNLSNGASLISHFTQNLDGRYSNTPNDAARSGSSAVTFKLTDKYTGFTVSQYKTSLAGSNNWSNYWPGRANQEVRLRQAYYNYYRYYDLNIYYERNKYKLEYLQGINNETIASRDILYEAPIGPEYNREAPERPRDGSGNYLVPQYYDFQGWFKDPSGQVKFDFSGINKMQDHNQVVYAVWKPHKVTVKFDLNGGKAEDGKPSINDQIFDAGNKADKPDRPKKDGYEFAGWINKKTGTVVSFEKVITEDLEVIATWISKHGYRTTYDPNGGTGTRQLGPRIYAPDSPVEVVSINPEWNWSPPPGKVGFLHWNTQPDDKGDAYFPGEELPYITENTVLYAIWSKDLDTSVKYDRNYDKTKPSPGSMVVVVPFENHAEGEIGFSGNNEIIVPDERGDNYDFLGWSRIKNWRSEEQDGKLIDTGEKFIVDSKNEDNENTLYAQWQRNIDIYLSKDVVGNMGDANQKFKFRWTTEYKGEVKSGEETISQNSGVKHLLFNVPEGTQITVEEINLDGTSHIFEKIEVLEGNLNVDEIAHMGMQGTVVGSKWTFTVQSDSNDMLLTYTNRRDAEETPLTGIFTGNRPYYLLLIPAATLLYAFRRKRGQRYEW